MSGYTPTTEAVRAKYARGTRSDGTPAQFVKWQKEFDRWLAAHDAEVLAAAGVAPQPEPEYEYGVGWNCNGVTYAYLSSSRANAEIDVAKYPDFEGEPQFVVRRIPARYEGRWAPAPNHPNV